MPNNKKTRPDVKNKKYFYSSIKKNGKWRGKKTSGEDVRIPKGSSKHKRKISNKLFYQKIFFGTKPRVNIYETLFEWAQRTKRNKENSLKKEGTFNPKPKRVSWELFKNKNA